MDPPPFSRGRVGGWEHPVECAEGCGCEVRKDAAHVRTIDGVEQIFCCSDCADVFQEGRSVEVAEALRRYVLAGQTTVDHGCGAGYYTQLLMEFVGPRGTVYAVDANPERIQQARRHLGCRFGPEAPERVRFLDTTRSIPESSVDLMLSNNVLCCAIDRLSEVKEMMRLLRPAGYAYVRVNSVRVKGVAPIEDREWKALFSGWNCLDEGAAGTMRWKLLTRPTLTEGSTRP